MLCIHKGHRYKDAHRIMSNVTVSMPALWNYTSRLIGSALENKDIWDTRVNANAHWCLESADMIVIFVSDMHQK